MMELMVKPSFVEFRYEAVLKESMLSVTVEESRISLIKKFLKAFDLRLNDIKFDGQALSNNYIHFSKFYGSTFFDVSFGLEEISARLRMPTDEAQVADLYGRLFQIFEDNPISVQRMNIQRQCSTEGDVASFFQTLNPHTPKKFQELLYSRGMIYDLKVLEHELYIHVLIANSLVVEGGLYLNIDFEFSPNKYDFENALRITKDQHEFIFKELGLKIATET
jgi:hypothetical protein